MESEAQQEPSQKRRRLTEEILTPSFDLASLLDDERFLLLVFEHLVEHGLQNCRLVCRRWREACKQFPVVLEGVNTDELEMFDAFPNATSVFTHGSTKFSVLEVFEHLSSLNSLTSLSVGLTTESYHGSGPPCFQSMAQLTDLSIFDNQSSLPDNLVASVKHLTNLTRLYLHGGSPTCQLDPFVELRKIEDLSANDFALFDKNGAAMFPALTNLTRLSFHCSFSCRSPPLIPTARFNIYASSLRHLVLFFVDGCDTQGAFAPMTSLTNLETLELYHSRSYSLDLLQVLPQLSSLTSLVMKHRDYLDLAVRATITRCTGLRALHVAGSYIHGRREHDVSLVPYLTQLTDLAINHYGKLLTDLTCLTLLQHLRLAVQSDRKCCLDEVLECMPSLRSIDVKLWDENHRMSLGPYIAKLRLSGSALSATCHLKSMSLRQVAVDKHFLHALASKTGLTKLDFVSPPNWKCSPSFVSQVNLLKNLIELGLCLEQNYNVCALLSPENLSNLKRLRIDGAGDEEVAVRRRFNQSSRRVLVNGEKDSAWRSRLTTP